MSALYAAAQTQMLSGLFDVSTVSLAAFLIDSTYTPNFASDTTVGNIPSGAPLCGQIAMTRLSASGGVLQADNVTLTGVDMTRSPAALIICEVVDGTPSHSKLLAYIDGGLGFGVLESSTVQVTWDNRGIFAP